MNAVREEVEALIDKELDFSMTKYPLFSSTHEGYAVLLEEVEEADVELRGMHREMEELWKAVKNDTATQYRTNVIYTHALYLAIEAIQVAAMSKKYTRSIVAERNVNKDGD